MKEIRSSYQKKNYEVIKYYLSETSCPKCGRPFMVDFSYLKSVEIDGDYDFVRIICPYCGKKHYEHL